MKSININFDFFWVSIVVLLIIFHGEPDIIDCIVYRMSGVWQTASGALGLGG